jgi:hypothetical protein
VSGSQGVLRIELTPRRAAEVAAESLRAAEVAAERFRLQPLPRGELGEGGPANVRARLFLGAKQDDPESRKHGNLRPPGPATVDMQLSFEHSTEGGFE